MNNSHSDSYKAAGVDVTAGYKAVELMKSHIERTRVPGVMSSIGGFGGLFDLGAQMVENPVLVSGTDGVGTKLKIAFLMDKHDTVGIDCVAMCANDVVCAGAKMILDIGLTLEYLETMGVPVLGFNTDDFPAFYCRKSGFGVDYNAPTALDVARVAKTKWDLGLAGGMLIGNPVPEEYAMDFTEMSAIIDKALASAAEAGVRGKNITPYLLAHIVEYTGGRSLATNIQLAYNNARVAAAIAVELAKL